MDRRHSDFYRKVIGTAALLTTVLLFTGCAADPAKENFNTVSSNLERGGSFYHVYTENGTLKQLIGECFSNIDRAVAESNLPEAKRTEMRGKLVAAKFLFSLFAFEHCTGMGASSTIRKVPGEKDLFSNRIFIAIPEQNSCFFDWVFSREAGDVGAIAASLPQETFYTIGLNVSVPGILDLFRNAGTLGDALLSELPSGFPLDVVSDLEGWCMIAAARRNGFPPNEDCIMIRLPDKKGKIFDFIGRLPVAMKADSADPMRRKLLLRDPGAGMFDPVMVKQGGMVIFFNSPAAEKLFTRRSNGSLKENGHFLRYSKGVPESGSAFLYCRNLPGGNGLFASSAPVNGVDIPIGFGDSFNVLTRTADGWLSRGLGDLDIPGETFTRSLAHHLVRLLEVRSEVKNQVKSAKAGENKKLNRECKKKFALIYQELQKYAKANNGKFPYAVDGKFKLPELSGDLTKKVIGFSGIAPDSKNIPLMIDAPGRHRNSFCVFYADGSMKSYKLENPGTVRRMISFLYTVHRWEISVFQNLIKQAQQIDEASAKK